MRSTDYDKAVEMALDAWVDGVQDLGIVADNIAARCTPIVEGGGVQILGFWELKKAVQTQFAAWAEEEAGR